MLARSDHIWPRIWLARNAPSERNFDCATFLMALACRPTTASTPTENNKIAIMASSSRIPFCRFAASMVFMCETPVLLLARSGVAVGNQYRIGVAHLDAPRSAYDHIERPDLGRARCGGRDGDLGQHRAAVAVGNPLAKPVERHNRAAASGGCHHGILRTFVGGPALNGGEIAVEVH